MTKITLEVGLASLSDGGRDIVRINARDRPPGVDRYDIIKLTVGNQSKSVTVLGNDSPGVINIDIDLRNQLGVDDGRHYEFEVEKLGLFRQFLWQWYATDPAVRLPAQLSIISFILGAIGLFLGIISIWPSHS